MKNYILEYVEALKFRADETKRAGHCLSTGRNPESLGTVGRGRKSVTE